MKKQIIVLGLVITGVTSLSIGVTAQEVKEPATARFDLVAPTTGTLKIVKADDLSFSQQTLSASDIVTTNQVSSAITIEELSGTAPGWTLSVALDNFKSATKTITGAQIFYPSVVPTTTNGGSTSAIQPVSVSTDNAFDNRGDKGKIISAGKPQQIIVKADKGKGYGSWTMTYPVNKLQLKIPAGQLPDAYTAKLTYTLSDTP